MRIPPKFTPLAVVSLSASLKSRNPDKLRFFHVRRSAKDAYNQEEEKTVVSAGPPVVVECGQRENG